jgi:hypothetical protein
MSDDFMTVNNEFERIWKKFLVFFSRYISHICMEELG